MAKRPKPMLPYMPDPPVDTDNTLMAGNAYTGNMLDNKTPPVGASHPYGPRGQSHAPRSGLFGMTPQGSDAPPHTGPTRLGTDQTVIHNVPGAGYLVSGVVGELL